MNVYFLKVLSAPEVLYTCVVLPPLRQAQLVFAGNASVSSLLPLLWPQYMKGQEVASVLCLNSGICCQLLAIATSESKQEFTIFRVPTFMLCIHSREDLFIYSF